MKNSLCYRIIGAVLASAWGDADYGTFRLAAQTGLYRPRRNFTTSGIIFQLTSLTPTPRDP